MFVSDPVIHRTQLWFHGRIPREESHKMIHQQGRVDGYGSLVIIRNMLKETTLVDAYAQMCFVQQNVLVTGQSE